MQSIFKSKRKINIVFAILFSTLTFSQISSIPKEYKQKTSPFLIKNTLKSTSIDCRLLVKDIYVFEKWAKCNKINYSKTRIKNVINVTGIDKTKLAKLLKEENVLYIDLPVRNPIDERYIDLLDLSVNQVNSAHHKYSTIKGSSLTVSVKEKPFDTLDIDLRHRILTPSKGTGSVSSHATMMATIIAGGGNSGIKGLGVAPEAAVVTSSYETLLPDNNDILIQEKVSVQNHSYGVGSIENYYGIESQLYDEQSNSLPHLLHVFSSGNIGNSTSDVGPYSSINNYANLTGQFKSSKNSICVGSVDAFGKLHDLSSRGPTHDGRIKPEIVAYGANGTSDAASLVSGIGILIQDAYKQIHNILPPSSLVKAALINSATDIGTKGPDFSCGFGLVSAHDAIKSIIDGRYFLGSLSKGLTKMFNIEVPENVSNVKVTLAWNDPNAEAGANKALVNDIDLELVHIATETKYYPWVLNHQPNLDSLIKPAKRKIDTLNNVEQITIENPIPGVYDIYINGKKLSKNNQPFSIVYEFEEEGFSWIYPLSSNKLNAGEEFVMRWSWAGENKKINIDYKSIDDDKWINIVNSIDASQENYEWKTSNENSKINFRIKTDDLTFISDTILVSQALKLKVGFNCEDELMLYWPKIDGIKNYSLWQLKDMYLEKTFQTSDTIVVLEKDQSLPKYFAVSPVINNTEGIKGYTINYENQGTGCYIKSFYPIKTVTDNIQLQLKLGSTFNLNSLVLERLEDNIPIEIQEISPIQSMNIVLEDNEPKNNKNVYRVRINKEIGAPEYTHEEAVFFSTPNNLFIYPNPAINTDNLNIITANESIDATIYNTYGKKLKFFSEIIGQIKTIDISDLQSGLYILEVKYGDGKKNQSKINIIR